MNWETLAKVGGTLVILMGVDTLSHVARRLLDGGLPAETPAAVIQQGTIPRQRVVTGTLVNIAECANKANIMSPAIIVIGAVVALRDSLNWFETQESSEYEERLLAEIRASLMLSDLALSGREFARPSRVND